MNIETNTKTKHTLIMSSKEFKDLESVIISCMLHAPDDSIDQKNAEKFLHLFNIS